MYVSRLSSISFGGGGALITVLESRNQNLTCSILRQWYTCIIRTAIQREGEGGVGRDLSVTTNSLNLQTVIARFK